MPNQNKQPILLVAVTTGFGGKEVHVFELYKKLHQHGYPASILVSTNSPFSKKLTAAGLPHHTTYAGHFSGLLRPLYHLILKRDLFNIVKKEKIAIIHCNSRAEIPEVLACKKKYGVRTVLTRHDQDTLPARTIAGLDALIGVSKSITDSLQAVVQKNNLPTKSISFIPPVFDDTKFLTYQPTETRSAFFKNNFDIDVAHHPIITMIAHFARNKNHQLLLRAAAKLIHELHIPISVVLAGSGALMPETKALANTLAVEQYVHFLGNTGDTPGLLHYSDIFALSSTIEPLGIVYLEAGLMSKPSIGARHTGAEASIIHEQTGLFFKNNNLDDLVSQLERLIDNPAWARQLGQRAFEHVTHNFMPDITFARYEKVYQDLA